MNEVLQHFPLIVGLGNPGREYRGTRHNFGFEVCDRLAEQDGQTWKQARFADAETCRLQNGAWLVKPQTYMNLSGSAVRQCLKWFRFRPDQLLVIVDDIHLPCGQLRLRPTGSAGGHNGLKSIQTELKTQQYPRLRGGVGAPGHSQALKKHVLGKFSKDEQLILEEMIDHAAQAVGLAQQGGLDHAMNRINSQQS